MRSYNKRCSFFFHKNRIIPFAEETRINDLKLDPFVAQIRTRDVFRVPQRYVFKVAELGARCEPLDSNARAQDVSGLEIDGREYPRTSLSRFPY